MVPSQSPSYFKLSQSPKIVDTSLTRVHCRTQVLYHWVFDNKHAYVAIRWSPVMSVHRLVHSGSRYVPR